MIFKNSKLIDFQKLTAFENLKFNSFQKLTVLLNSNFNGFAKFKLNFCKNFKYFSAVTNKNPFNSVIDFIINHIRILCCFYALDEHENILVFQLYNMPFELFKLK